MGANLRFLRNVVLKALALFLVANLLFAAWAGSAAGLGRLSLYNRLFLGRLRLPFGENSAQAYNLSLYNLDAMFASHAIAGAPKAKDEYRVIVVGDSSVWGTLLRNDQTLTGRLNAAALTCSGRQMRFYNLGYPTISLTKDLMILSEALRYQPDLILWPTTLEAFPRARQLSTPLVANNPGRFRALVQGQELNLDVESLPPSPPPFWERTIIAQRRSLADLIRLQLYGVLWGATGVDQYYPAEYARAQVDFQKEDLIFHGWKPGQMSADDLAFDVLAAGIRIAGSTPVVVVNEPMLISRGKNSDVRYNLFYPHWAYDLYRQWLAERSRAEGWRYLDLASAVDPAEFTNSAIHLTPAGEQRFVDVLAPQLTALACR
ncbi:MAG TPA: hypothetical protein VMT46_16760 [Anaerolineaceae bacterium]|nr:hypothetical protein [Anaerolineaceae bacterium]